MPIIIEKERGQHYQIIADTIINIIDNNKGAVLVFFENENKLVEFKDNYTEIFKD